MQRFGKSTQTYWTTTSNKESGAVVTTKHNENCHYMHLGFSNLQSKAKRSLPQFEDACLLSKPMSLSKSKEMYSWHQFGGAFNNFSLLSYGLTANFYKTSGMTSIILMKLQILSVW